MIRPLVIKKMEPLKIERVEENDSFDDSFVSLLTQNQRVIHVFIASLVPFVDSRDDILQEVNLVLWKKRENFELGTNFKAWAFTVARFVTMNQQKKYRREKVLVFGEQATRAIAEHWEHQQLDFDQRLSYLGECLTQLNDGDRELVVGCYQSRGAIQRLADERNQSSSTIRGILLRLRKQLLRCIHIKSKRVTA